jgi:2-polyprenyl-6-hydroxyphenyl methylase/3-demethylubiquinone-9 3-methyltransferase
MDLTRYNYANSESNDSHAYLVPSLLGMLTKSKITQDAKILDLGCGNGYVTSKVTELGLYVEGIDPSMIGIKFAHSNYPHIKISQGVIEEIVSYAIDYDLVYSLEVIEHVFDPTVFLSDINKILKSDSYLILSTPYHSYIKNLVLSLTGKMDQHFNALQSNGHIKFFSRKTLEKLLSLNGFRIVEFRRVGRIPILAKSMIILLKKTDVLIEF